MDKKTWVMCTHLIKSAFPHSHAFEDKRTKRERDNGFPSPIEVWYEMLKQYPDEVVMLSTKQVLRTVRSFPAIADFVETIEANTTPEYAKLWDQVKLRIGSFINPVWSAAANGAVEPRWSDDLDEHKQIAKMVDNFGGLNKVKLALQEPEYKAKDTLKKWEQSYEQVSTALTVKNS